MAAISLVDQETEFRDWRKGNPDGYILNTTRKPSDKYLILHTARCWTISGEPARGRYGTKDFIKVCAPKRHEIDAWVDRQFGAAARSCPFLMTSIKG